MGMQLPYLIAECFCPFILKADHFRFLFLLTHSTNFTEEPNKKQLQAVTTYFCNCFFSAPPVGLEPTTL